MGGDSADPGVTDHFRAEWARDFAKRVSNEGKKMGEMLCGVARLAQADAFAPDMERWRVWTLRIPVDEATPLLPEEGGPRRPPDMELVKERVSPLACDAWRETDNHLASKTQFVVVAFESAQTAREVREEHHGRWRKGESALRLEYGRRAGTFVGWRREELMDRLCITGVLADSAADAIELAMGEVNAYLLEAQQRPKPDQVDMCERFSAQAKRLGDETQEEHTTGQHRYRVWLTVYGEENAGMVVRGLDRRRVRRDSVWRVSGSTKHRVCYACGGSGHLAGSGECWADKYVLRVDTSSPLNKRIVARLVECSGAKLGFSGFADRHKTLNLHPKKFGHLVFDDEVSMIKGAGLLVKTYYPTGVLGIPLTKPGRQRGMPKGCAACGLVDFLADRAGLKAHTHLQTELCPASRQWRNPHDNIEAYVRALEKRSPSVVGSPRVFWNGTYFSYTEGSLCEALAAVELKLGRKKPKATQATGAGVSHTGTTRAPASPAGQP